MPDTRSEQLLWQRTVGGLRSHIVYVTTAGLDFLTMLSAKSHEWLFWSSFR